MAKKTKRYASGARGRWETDPSRRMAMGKGSTLDYEELSKMKKFRRKPQEWKELAGIFEGPMIGKLDEVVVAAGLGAVRDTSLETADEITAALSMMIGKDYKKSRTAIRKFLDEYEDNYPGSDLAGRAIGQVGQIAFLGGASTVGFLGRLMARYGLKTTVGLAKMLEFAHNKYPRLAKLAKLDADKYLDDIVKLIKDDKIVGTAVDIAAPAAGTAADIAVYGGGQSEEDPYAGLKSPMMGLAGIPLMTKTGQHVGEWGANKLAKATVPFTSKNVMEHLFDLPTEIVKKKLKYAGYSEDAIDYLVKFKKGFPRGSEVTSEAILHRFKELVERGLNDQAEMAGMALSKLSGTSRPINKNVLIEDINNLILDQFKRPGYAPKYSVEPLAAQKQWFGDPIELEDFEKSLKGRADKELMNTPPPGKDPQRDHRHKTDYVFKNFKPIKSKKKSVHGKRLGRPKNERTIDQLTTPGPDFVEDSISDVSGRTVPPTREQAATGKETGLFYEMESPLRTKFKNVLESSGNKNKALVDDLLELRDRLIDPEGVYKTNLSETELLDLIGEIGRKADYDSKLVGSANFPEKTSLDAYKAAHGTLHHKWMDERLGHSLEDQNPRFHERHKPSSGWSKAFSSADGSARIKEGSFKDLFGIDVVTRYIDDGTGKQIRVKEVVFPDPKETRKAIEQAIVIPPQDYKNKHQKSFQNFIDKSYDLFRAKKKYAEDSAIDRVPVNVRPGQLFTPMSSEKTRIKDWIEDQKKISKEKPKEYIEEFRRNLLGQRFSQPETANALIDQMQRDSFGELTNKKYFISPAKEGEAFNTFRRGLRWLFWGEPMWLQGAALVALRDEGPVDLAIRRKHASAAQMLEDAEKWKDKFKSNPDEAIKFTGFTTDQIKKIDARLPRLLDRDKAGENKEVTPVHPDDEKQGSAPQEQIPPTIQRPPTMNRAPAVENFEPITPEIPFRPEERGEFEESFEVENIVDPEIEDREKRKDRINSFLKQQGAYKRRKRRSYA
jgi:hypothetical protein